eukprot:3298782-Prymnesium_polylepis.1
MEHVPTLNSKPSPPSAAPPPDVRFVASVGGDVGATLTMARARFLPRFGGGLGGGPATARRNACNLSAFDEASGAATLESDDVCACGLQARRLSP